jgi:hypothetical protein
MQVNIKRHSEMPSSSIKAQIGKHDAFAEHAGLSSSVLALPQM